MPLTIDDQIQIQHQIDRIHAILRNDPAPHERFVLQAQLEDFQDRLSNPSAFEQKRREFLNEVYR